MALRMRFEHRAHREHSRFGGIAGAAVGGAKIVVFVALVLLVISLVSTGFRGGFRRVRNLQPNGSFGDVAVIPMPP